MKIFADLHHQDLYYSLQLLFEKRLGCELYRPIGLEWWNEKYWNVFPHIGTAQQYLSLDQAEKIPEGVNGPFQDHHLLNKNYRYEDGIYYVMDRSKDKVQRAITLDKFKSMKFDILISSIPQHIPIFNELIRQFQPQAKHIFQVGNAWGQQQGVKNILSSTAPFPVSSDINACFYHQEFDLNVFKYEPPTSQTKVFSFIHLMKEQELLHQYKQILVPLGWEFMTFGAGMEHDIAISSELADRHKEKGWLWHIKPEGDGYGHNLHNSYACGRPAIIKQNYYYGKLGNLLLEDMITCVDISRRTVQENAEILKALSDPDKHLQMCENAYKRFCDVVNFDAEEQQIRKFIENLK